MKVGRQVERWHSPDGKHVLRLFSRGESCFYFVELSEVSENEETFWTASHTSDGYASLEEARGHALAHAPWIKDAM